MTLSSGHPQVCHNHDIPRVASQTLGVSLSLSYWINVSLGEERPASSTTARFLDRDPFRGRAVLDNGPPK